MSNLFDFKEEYDEKEEVGNIYYSDSKHYDSDAKSEYLECDRCHGALDENAIIARPSTRCHIFHYHCLDSWVCECLMNNLPVTCPATRPSCPNIIDDERDSMYPYGVMDGGYSKLNLFSFIVLIMIIAYLLVNIIMKTKLNVYRQNYQFNALN
jgi:hypothetical protein